MVVFWIFAILMVALAFAFIIPPLLGKGRTGGVVREALNVEIFKDRQDELDNEFNGGVLTAEQHEQAVSELQRDLLFNADDEVAPAVKDINSGRWASIVVGLAVPLLAIGLYLVVGNADLIGKDFKAEAAQDGGGHNAADMSKMIADLKQRLEADPNDSEGWGILARSLMQADRFAEAADAYARAYKLIGDNPGLMAEYAEALTLAAGGNKPDLAIELVSRVLEIEPMNPRALWLGGSIAYQENNYQLAVDRWSPLLNIVAPGSPEEQGVREAIAEATVKGGLGTASMASASSGRINLRVELPAALQDKVSAEDVVFVYARALEGPPMPIAIKRFQVKDLPVNVMLDDSAAMMATRKLSMFSEVSLMARISKSGNAKAEAGDLKGQVVAKVGGSQTVNVLINEEIQADGSAKVLATGANTSAAAAPANDGSIKLYVELSDGLKASVDANDTVFIYAKAMQGPPMPIAIKRLQVKDLPVKVVLDDSSAMMPNRKLSMFDQVSLVARVSKSGTATSSPGDLQGEQGGKVGNGQLVELMIDQVIK